MKNRLLLISLFIGIVQSLFAQQFQLNHLGFYTNAQKIAIVTASNNSTFKLIESSTAKIVYTGSLSTPATWSSSGETVSVIDFSSYKSTGNYYLQVGESKSACFDIKSKDVFADVSKWSIKAFYLWRASTAIDAKYAQFGKWNFARAAGHKDNVVSVHSSASTTNRPTGTKLSAPKGWYDAGDYNLYTVNASQAVFSLLQLYENYPSIYDTLNLNIPESSNALPDILDEVKWEIDWLKNMIDTLDGSVYHKLTSLYFCGMVVPSKDDLPRYMVGHSTTAALDFAAMMAKSSRIFKKYNFTYPGYSDTLLYLAKKAYNWAVLNPSVTFVNPSDVSTGSYKDANPSDEFFWARVELYIATGDISYFNAINIGGLGFVTPTWYSVQMLGLLSLYQSIDTLNIPLASKTNYITIFNSVANSLVQLSNSSPYRTPINNFQWGSNGYTAAQGQVVLTAYKKTRDSSYLRAGLNVLDYLLGRNPTGYAFTSGFGNRSPLKLHDRRSDADGILAPIPGYIVGGPSAEHQNDCGTSSYPSTYPAKSYTDLSCSYSTNEIAVNWQGPFAYLVGAIDAELNNFNILPLKAQTDSLGKLIMIQFPVSIKEDVIDNSEFILKNNEFPISIDSIKVDMLNNSILNIYIKTSEINKDSTNILIEYKGNSIKALEPKTIDSSFIIPVFNNIIGSKAYILDAKTNKLGDTIFITLNKKLAYLSNAVSSVSFVTNGLNILKTISISKDDSTVIIATITKIYNNQNIAFSYNGNDITATDSSKLQTVENVKIKNNAQAEPPKPIGITASDNGLLATIIFDKAIIGNGSKLDIAAIIYNKIKGTSQPAIVSSNTLNTYTVTVTIKPRLIQGDSLILSYKSGSLFSYDGDSVLSFNNVSVSPVFPSAQDTFIIKKDSISKIESEDFAYIYGFITEQCSDTLATLDLTKASSSYWADYFVDVKDSGNYTLTARVAASSASKFVITNYSLGNNTIATVNIPSTSSLQKWISVKTNILLNKGIQTIRLYSLGANYAVNWLSFEFGKYSTSIPFVEESEYSIYPNPSNDGTFQLTLPANCPKSTLKVIDFNGRIVYDDIIEPNTTSKSLSIKQRGAYIIQITNKDKINSLKCIVE